MGDYLMDLESTLSEKFAGIFGKKGKLCKLGLNKFLRMRATQAACIRVASAVRDPGRSLVDSKVK